jgi:hypothetical protein
VDSLNGPLLTEAGKIRMQLLLSLSRPPTSVAKPTRLTVSEKATALHLRKSLHGLPNPLPAELSNEITRMPEKAYAGLLRACVERDLPDSARILLCHRPLPAIGKQKLLERFIDAGWLGIWDVCAEEAFLDLTTSRFGYNALLHRVMGTGSIALLQAVLESITAISTPAAQILLEHAFKQNRKDMFNAILNSKVVQPIRSECLFGCFRDCLFDHRESEQFALYLLEIGVRPIETIQPDEIIQPYYWLVEDTNLPVLKRALEFEPPTHKRLLKLLSSGHVRPGVAFNYLRTISRQLPHHKERMSRLAFRAATSFICNGEKEFTALLDLCFQDGASFTGIASSELEKSDLLIGYKWRKREGNWIDLIGHLLKSGRREDAEIIKKLKRSRRKKIVS